LPVGAHDRAPLPQNLQIPPTVQGILAARIDRLAPDEKALLQQLSVIGRQFPLSLIRQVIAQPEADLYRRLASLQHKEFLYEQPAFPESEYIFKHALTQEVAYNSVLLERRKALHEQTARAIEALYRTTTDDHYGELAHHFSRSGNTPKAVEYLQLAGQQAARQSANAEAIVHLTTALALLHTMPETADRARQELSLCLSLGASSIATKGYGAAEVEQSYTRAQELCLQVGEPHQVTHVLFGRWTFTATQGNHTAARALGEQFLTIAHQHQDTTLTLVAHVVMGGALLFLGEFAPAQVHLNQAWSLYNPEHHRDLTYQAGQNPGLTALGFATEALWCRGYPDQALERVHHVLSVAHALAHPLSLADALTHVAFVHLFRHEDQEAHAQTEALLTLAHKHGFAGYLGSGACLQGWALVERGERSGAREQREAGLVQIREGLATWQATGAEISVPLLLGVLAQGSAQGGQAEAGLEVIAEALAMVEKNEERWNEAELYRIKGELTFAHEVKSQKSKSKSQKSENPNLQSAFPNPQSEAEACFLKAIEISRRQQAKSLELRASTSLARLWRSQGKHAEAHQVLSEIYNWFTEGFDTKDLQEAKGLLEELRERTS
jgi:predicted ATPase